MAGSVVVLLFGKLPMRAISSVCAAAVIAMVLGGLLIPAQAQLKVDAKLPDYQAVSGVSGSLKSIGSDTMNNEMALWAEGFAKFYPNVQAEIEGKGSTTGPP